MQGLRITTCSRIDDVTTCVSHQGSSVSRSMQSSEAMYPCRTAPELLQPNTGSPSAILFVREYRTRIEPFSSKLMSFAWKSVEMLYLIVKRKKNVT